MIRGLARFSVASSTIALRLVSYIYLRWIPSPILWPAVIFFWIQFILSFILLLYLDLDPSEPVVNVETTDIIEVVTNGSNGEKTIVETEIDTVDIVELPTRSVSWMETVYLGIPNPNLLLSFLTTGINAVLLIMALDLTFRSSLFYPVMDLMFHRPIPTSPYSANIFIRNPPEAPSPLRLYYKPVHQASWGAGPVAFEFNQTSDFTTIVTLDGLSPSTPYTYAVLPPDIDVNTLNKSSFGTFETFPKPRAHGRWSFGSSSCIQPRTPYNPLDHPLRVKGLESLEKDIPDLKFFTFLGDFIYADIPHRRGSPTELYFQKYRQSYASPSFQNILPNLPFYHVYDDHDISNDYDQGESTSIFHNASQSFNAYHRNANPPPLHPDVNYFVMDYGDTSFFFLDTRRYRASNFAEDGPEKTMLGKRQLKDLFDWAIKAEEKGVIWKFIISSVPMTNNWKGPNGQRDTWGGFMHERSLILENLQQVSNVVVISGDRHEAAVTALPNDVLEISVSPLNQFYAPTRTYHSSETDKEIAYFPDGNQKHAIYTIDTTNASAPILEVQLKIYGGTVWKHTFQGKQVVPGKRRKSEIFIDGDESAFMEKAWKWFERAVTWKLQL